MEACRYWRFVVWDLLHRLVIPPFYGGCEGLPMLNRTNRTLSALALSNGLNLGTRSLAANASVSHGDQILRIRRPQDHVMRDGMVWYSVVSDSKPEHGKPPFPGSFSPEQQRQFGCVTLQQACVAVDFRVEPDPRPADLVGRPDPKRAAKQAAIPAAAKASATSGK
jgi:hypothetical protein